MTLIVNAKCQSYDYSFSNDSFKNVGWRTCIFCGGAGNGGGEPSDGDGVRGLAVCDVTRRVLAMGLSRLELRHGSAHWQPPSFRLLLGTIPVVGSILLLSLCLIKLQSTTNGFLDSGGLLCVAVGADQGLFNHLLR